MKRLVTVDEAKVEARYVETVAFSAPFSLSPYPTRDKA